MFLANGLSGPFLGLCWSLFNAFELPPRALCKFGNLFSDPTHEVCSKGFDAGKAVALVAPFLLAGSIALAGGSGGEDEGDGGGGTNTAHGHGTGWLGASPASQVF